MKVKKDIKLYRSVTLRIAEKVMQKVDQIAATEEVSRQKLIESIIETAIEDKKFAIRIETTGPVVK